MFCRLYEWLKQTLSKCICDSCYLNNLQSYFSGSLSLLIAIND